MPDEELVQRIALTTGLSPREAARVVDDVLAWYGEEVEEYVRRRHAELHLYGTRNAEAYRLIAEDVAARVVAPPRLSERQIRRIIYG